MRFDRGTSDGIAVDRVWRRVHGVVVVVIPVGRDDNLPPLPQAPGQVWSYARGSGSFQEREPLDLLAGVINCTSFNQALFPPVFGTAQLFTIYPCPPPSPRPPLAISGQRRATVHQIGSGLGPRRRPLAASTSFSETVMASYPFGAKVTGQSFRRALTLGASARNSP